MPHDPISSATLCIYKTVLRNIWKLQLARGIVSYHWEYLWDVNLESIAHWVKKRKAIADKSSYKEKVDHTFAPYECVEKFNAIENEFWRRGYGGQKSAFALLKHRFCLLFSTSSILRAESLFRGELSDFAGLFVKKSTDVHPIYVMMMQFNIGKCLKKFVLK